MASKAKVQPLGLSKLTEQVTSQAEAAKERGRAMLGHRDAYSKLKDKLETLSDTMRHQVMVPFTSKAFMPGQLVHTNEILVLLGDNWFVETSAKNAAEIAERRITECDKMLVKIEEEVKLIEGWRKQAGAVGKEQEECVDIQEEFEEDTEKKWKIKHKENVKKEREKENTKVETDEDMWRRLEELEVEEALEKQWENEESSEQETDTEEESDLESDEESEQAESVSEPSDTENDKGLSISNLGADFNTKASKKKLGRRVSWAAIDDSDGENVALCPGKLIKFVHSTQPPPEETLSTDNDGVPHTPSDLQHYARQQPKSILKHTDAEILIREVPEQYHNVDDTEHENLEPALQETVLERAVCDKPLSQPEEPKRISKFKASRLKGKE
eukprot:GFUD01040583.1.p1 GENE.GFUD01040583.1~~GFUD01040583.1.p1  ORF type:complete len:386 (+),score=119.07 GFUD01040583.1:38-1195(+)